MRRTCVIQWFCFSCLQGLASLVTLSDHIHFYPPTLHPPVYFQFFFLPFVIVTSYLFTSSSKWRTVVVHALTCVTIFVVVAEMYAYINFFHIFNIKSVELNGLSVLSEPTLSPLFLLFNLFQQQLLQCFIWILLRTRIKRFKLLFYQENSLPCVYYKILWCLLVL